MDLKVGALGLLFGAIGLFYYGMKSLSFALQGAIGDSTFTAVGRLKGGRLRNTFLGSMASLTVNSSAMTVVTIMGLVNAGIVGLAEALGFVMGANLGTTFYPWLLSFLPYEAGLYLLGVGIIPGLVSHQRYVMQVGRAMVAFGMLLLGMALFEQGIARVGESYLGGLANYHSVIFLLAGLVISLLFRSSLASFALVATLSLRFPISVTQAMVFMMGANLGPALYPWWLSRERSVYARRVALGHILFNFTGLILGALSLLVLRLPPQATPMYIALAHVCLNLAPALSFLLLQSFVVGLLERLIPDDPVREQYKLAVLGRGADLIPATAISQIKLQVEKQKDIVDRMLERTYEYLSEAKSDARTMAKIKDYERICDNISREVTDYIVKLMEKPLDSSQAALILGLARASKEFESISDYLDKIAIAMTDLDHEGGVSSDVLEEVQGYFELIREFYHSVATHLERPGVLDLKLLSEAAFDLRRKGEVLRRELFEDLIEDKASAHKVRLVTDLVMSARKVRGHILNLAEALGKMGESEGF